MAFSESGRNPTSALMLISSGTGLVELGLPRTVACVEVTSSARLQLDENLSL
jgi:hypothetical protein